MEQVPYSPTDYVALSFDLFETSSDAVYITRVSDGVVLDANDSALSLFGYTRTEAIGHSTQELDLWANLNDRQAFLDAMKREGKLRRYAVRFPDEMERGIHLGTLRHTGADAWRGRDPRGRGPRHFGVSIKAGRRGLRRRVKRRSRAALRRPEVPGGPSRSTRRGPEPSEDHFREG